ncbi:MAG: hypothetical protein DI598_06125 [Pseudopedobacter saltans]|uniref:DUF6089 domain-containing protein n=1 Tax=Pseudopedobacter saltans TaxID=151895 RepID=A0A2W5F1V5_9SPHI|nr:MAG: hypothetical protein DI598_06125 [Pseudopedobacter saltans]
MAQELFAQNFWDKSELGFSVGGIKYIGGEPSPSTQFSGGILGKYLLSDKLAIRAQITAGTIVSNTNAVPTIALPENKEFRLGIMEFSVMPEYDFININTGEKKFTTYVFLGISYFYYTRTYRLVDSVTNTSTSYKYPRSKVPPILNIPVGTGFKYAFSPHVKAFAEGSFRLYLHQEFYSFSVGMTFNLGMFRGNGHSSDYNEKRRTNSSRQDCPPVYL